jgi:hypothetical protein
MRYIQRTQVTNAWVLVRIALGYLASRVLITIDLTHTLGVKTQLTLNLN